ncbi:hypothetical protein O1Q96_41025 [Streptomyces sp. Qhu-G9]|nr:hypothetical protein [Streptomyces aurantiacus]WAU85529.1 hypothetical protein O1Q96_41025 [Streptomyces aurantiacus]
MGMKDQFQDKAERLQQNAKQKSGERRDEASERGQQMPERERPERDRPDRERPDRERPERERTERERRMPEESQRTQQDAQGRFDQDFDI